MNDLRTPLEMEREKRRNVVCEKYVALKNEHPNLAPTRLMRYVSFECNLSLQGVSDILTHNGLYQPKKRDAKS